MKKGFFKDNKILSINFLYILSLIPLIIFGYYKNGYLVWHNGYIPFFYSLQYIIIPVIIILLSYVFETYYYVVVKKDDDMHNVFNSIAPFINTICYLICAPTNPLYITIPIIVILDVILKFIDKKFTINQIALFKCCLFGILYVMGIKGMANLYEIEMGAATGLKDLFLGFGTGGIGVTSSLCALIGLVILLFNSYYKKDVPFITIIGYGIVALIVYLVGDVTIKQLLVKAFSSSFIFVAIFVASLSNATPVVRSGRVLYALLVGMLSSVFVNVLDIYVGVYITVLVFSLLVPLFDKIKLSVN